MDCIGGCDVDTGGFPKYKIPFQVPVEVFVFSL